MSIFVSASVSFLIACIGWFLLEKRANRTSRRSESFSLITPIISILNEIEEMAEDQLFANLDAKKDLTQQQDLLSKRLVFSTKSLSKFDLLRSRLTLLSSRNIAIPNSKLIELKQSLTLASIDDISKYQAVLTSSQSIQLELHNAFERTYQ
ncbi:hypothetical protein AB4520_00870 [Vibrio renipiscarius]|uniref:hypothetical protein n=1 Tax=Vibrio renipiscarius TaxID=1461322 RepID=UPI00354E1DB1